MVYQVYLRRGKIGPATPPEPAGKITSSGVVTTGEFAGKQLNTLMTGGKVALDESSKTFNVTGTINKVADWNALPVAERTNYYVPIILNGRKGEAIKMKTLSGGSKTNIFGQTQDTDTTMNLVLAFKRNEPVRQFTVYKNQKNAEADKDGTVYKIDCSGATFQE